MPLTLRSAVLLSTLLLLGFLLTACNDSDKARSKSKKSAHIVESVAASYQAVSIERTIAGTLQAIREVRIISQTKGLLTELPVYPGDKVSKSQLLAKLDDSRLQAELLKAKASLNQAKLDLRRLKDLAPRQLASESEIAQAKTQKDIAAAELQLKQTELAYTRVIAPITGVISKRLVEPGDALPVHTHILSLLDTSHLKAEIHISELLLPLISTGNDVDITIDALGDSVFKGRIARIYPSIDKVTRKGTIEVVLDPVPEGALAGQLCRVTIYTAKKQRLMIPYEAVRHDKQGAYVFTIDNNVAKRTNITTGIQVDEQVEVLQGLTDQQAIIHRGFFGLKNNTAVNVVNSSQNTGN